MNETTISLFLLLDMLFMGKTRSIILRGVAVEDRLEEGCRAYRNTGFRRMYVSIQLFEFHSASVSDGNNVG